MNSSRSYQKSLLALLILFLSFSDSKAQVGLIDDFIKAGSKISKAQEAGKIASYADKIEDLRVPITAASRNNLGIPLYDVALENIRKFPEEANKARVYLGMEGEQLTFVPDMFKMATSGSEFNTGSLDDYLKYLKQQDPNTEINYIVEADLLDNINYQEFFDSNGERIFLSNYDGLPWRIRKIEGRNSFVAEIKPSLFIDIDDTFLKEVMSLFDLALDTDEIRVISLFDEGSDFSTIDAIKDATKTSVSYDNIIDKSDLLSIIRSKKGQVIAIIGHVEDKEFVIRNALGKEVTRFNIEELQKIALEKQSSLLLLGCETAKIPDIAGMPNKINSFDVASQLKTALQSKNYGDFFASLGSEKDPFIITKEVINNAHEMVAKRIDENSRIERTSINTIRVSPKLSQSQAALGEQIFRILPKWLDDVVAFLFGVIVLAFIISIFSSSSKPIKFTITAILTLFYLPILGVTSIYKFAIKPKTNPDRMKSTPLD